MSFNALVVRKDDEGKTSAAVEQVGVADLPEGEVLVAVDYSTVNYKDGLCIGRSEEHTSELQSLMRISYAVFCLRSEERRVGKEC